MVLNTSKIDCAEGMEWLMYVDRRPVHSIEKNCERLNYGT
jgi:hypothetical protein